MTLLRVIHVLVPEPPGEVGGADLHVLDLARMQLLSGVRPVIAERGSPEYAMRARAAGIEVASFSGQTFGESVQQLGRLIERYSPDIIHAHGYDADYWAAATRVRYRKLLRTTPLVFTQHGVVEDTMWHRFKTLVDRMCTRSANGLIVCAHDLLPRMRQWCPKGTVRHIPNGVAPPATMPQDSARSLLASKYDIPLDRRLLGYVGRLSPEKRPDRILRLIADATSSGLDVHGLLVGSGAMRQELEDIALRLSIQDRVTFTGLIDDTGLIYSALDAFLLLSDTEATPRALIEAMHCGTPVIGAAVGGIPQLLDNGRVGYLVPRGDDAAALEALCVCLAGSRDGEAARQRAIALYSIESMANSTNEFYSQLVG